MIPLPRLSSVVRSLAMSSALTVGLGTFAQATDPFEVAIMGDTQSYFNFMNDGGPDLFTFQTEWIRDHVASRNIAFVTQVGDVIQNDTAQWPLADLAVRPLDGAVPYSITFGNHDTNAPSQYFNASRYQGYSWYLGSSSDQMAHAQTFQAGGFTFLHLNLPHNCTTTQRNWAKTILNAHPGKPTIISTHGYMNDNGSGRATSGQNIWNDLIAPYPQVFMTCNGHDWVPRHEMDATPDGRKVIQLQVDWQEIINGGNSLMQLVRFDPDNGRIDATSYAPYLDIHHTDYTGQFSYAATFDAANNSIRIQNEIGATQRTWNAGGTNGNWSAAANWGGTAPAAGEQLVFQNSTRKATTNDLAAGTSFAGIVFRPGTYSNGYTLSGNGIKLTGDYVNMGGYGPATAQAGPVINLPIELVGDRQFNSGDWDITLNGAISGSGSLTKTHGRDYINGAYDGGTYIGDLYLTAVNSYTGPTRVTGGAIVLKNAASQNLVPNSSAIELYLNSVLKVTDLQNGTLRLASGQTLRGTGKVLGKTIAPSGSTLQPGHAHAFAGTLRFLDNLTLASGANIDLDLGGPVTGKSDQIAVTGTVDLGNARLNLTGLASYTPSIGDTMRVIDNDGADAITGFLVSGSGSHLSPGTHLSEGATVSNNFLGSGLSARISYIGGNGNDVVLTVYPGPGAPHFTNDTITLTSASVGQSVNASLAGTAIDGDGDALTFRKISGPSWLRVGPGGTLTGKPAAGNLGLNQFTIEVSDGNGGTDTAVLEVTVVPQKLVGRWDFDDAANITKATIGNDLTLTGSVTTLAGVNANDGAARIGVGSYLRCVHGIGANGGGTKTNEYTLVFDIRSPAASASKWISFFQTSPTNSNDAECFVRSTARTIGVSTTGYSTWTLPSDTWTQIAISVDNGSHYRIYANGQQILSANGQALDGNFSLDSALLFFADDNGEDNAVDVTTLRIYNSALTATEITQLGTVGDRDQDQDGLADSIDTDDDNDGLPDTWELANNLNPLLDDSALDSDGDGFTNAQEYVFGTDPKSPSTALAVQVTRDAPNGAAEISFPARADRYYTVLYSETLESNSWQTLVGPVQGNGGTLEISDIAAPTSRRFYRVVVEVP